MNTTTTNREDESETMAAVPAAEPLTIDETFEILKNSRRRLVLDYLQDVEGSVKLAEMADHVTAIENDTDVDSITSKERKRVYVGLYQFHLPKMADMGVIDYDQDRGDVALTESGRTLLREHDQRTTPDRRWYAAYLALAGGGLLGVVLAVVVQLTAVAVALLAAQSVLLLAVALAHAYTVEHRSLSG